MTRLLFRSRSIGCGLGVLLAAACTSSSLVEVAPPNAVVDPAVVTTAAGATQLYSFAVARWAGMVGGNFWSSPTDFLNYIAATGQFSDELIRVQGRGPSYDERSISESFTSDGNFSDINVNGQLNAIRVAASQAREALRTYAPNAPLAWQARLQAAEAYAIVYLAEFFCSGVPIPTVPLLAPVVYSRGLSTEDMLTRAVALFDSAATMAGDSTRFRYLAAVGKGRALLGLGRFADAAAAVAGVSTDFVFLLEVGGSATNVNPIGYQPQNVQVVNNKGGNGLAWSTDPRAAIVTTPSLSAGMLVPAKYSVTASGTLNAAVSNPVTPVRAADGLEARLIEAEAALATNDPSWLAKLNALRITCVGTAACAPVPGLTAAALPALADPGSANARLDLLMRERAMWLYLTGHRVGDLRRMTHLYHRDPMTLWPMGLYVNPGFPPLIPAASDHGTVSYGTIYVLTPYPQWESPNPLWTGCIDQNP